MSLARPEIWILSHHCLQICSAYNLLLWSPPFQEPSDCFEATAVLMLAVRG